MKEQDIKKKISSFVSSKGMLIHGVAAVKQPHFESKSLSPRALLEDAKSVICYGVPIPRGIIYAENNSLDLYWRYCNIQYRLLDSTSNSLCSFLEEKDCSATPIYSCFPWKVVNRKFFGYLPLVYWAEEAGLGKLGKCGLLVTPQYGIRVLLGGLITTKELEPNKKHRKDICPSDCFHCIDACPVEAIRRTGEVDHNLCIRNSTSNPLLTLMLNNSKTGKNYPFETLLNTIAIDDHGTYLCIECLKACPLNSK
jgi:epoxyqueuosine reductase QueG